MDRSVGPTLRWARAAVLAAVAMASGVLAHVSANGRLPGATAMFVVFLVCAAGAARFLAHPATRLRIIVLVIAGQTITHGVLTAMVGHRGDPPLSRPTATPPAALPVHAAPQPASVLPGGSGHRVGSLADLAQAGRPPAAPTQFVIPAPVQHLMADFTGPHALMAVAHVIAAVALGWWLARGERLLWNAISMTGSALADLGATARAQARLLTSLALVVLDVSRHAPLAAPRHRLQLPDVVAARWGRILATQTVRRGPPVPACG